MEINKKLLGVSMHMLRDNEHPLKSPNTRIVGAALAAGGEFAIDKPFTDTIDEEGKRQVTWAMSSKETIEFKPNFEAESINCAEFFERFEDLEWCEKNADHPIAYMRCMNDMINRLRDKIRTLKPMALIRRGKRLAIVPADATQEQRDEILGMI